MAKTNRFPNAKAALEYVVQVIETEAVAMGVTLDDVERQMLRLSWLNENRPEMLEVVETFEREYTLREFETKLSGLITSLRRRIRRGRSAELRAWEDAMELLWPVSTCVVVGLIEKSHRQLRPRGDLRNLLLASLVLTAAMLFGIFWLVDQSVNFHPPRGFALMVGLGFVLTASWFGSRAHTNTWAGAVARWFATFFRSRKA
jgi:hypothetical protein